jgi:hypothetical protein
MTASCALAIVLMSAAPSAPASTSECDLTDNRCKAKHYENRAATAPTPEERATYLYNASKSNLFLFKKTGDMADLCEARRTIDASLAVPHQPQAMRALSRTMRATLVSLERQHDTRCKPVTRQQHTKHTDAPRVTRVQAPKPPVVVAKSASSTDAPQSALSKDTTAAQVASDTSPASSVETRDPPVLLPVVARRPRPTSSPQDRLTSPRPRARVGVGVGLVTVGVGLLAGATAALVGRQGYDEKIATLKALGVLENRDLTMAEMADISAWDARYVRLEKTGAVLGGFAALSVVTAIVVFAVPKRRPVSQARVRSMGAGVHINF